jgi:hypothetical protein
MSNVPTPQNFNSLIPAPPSGRKNIVFQADTNNPRNVSAYADSAFIGGVSVITGTSYQVQQSDEGTLLVFTNNASVAVTLLASLTTNFLCSALFLGTAGGVITPVSGTINGVASVSAAQGSGGWLFFNGTNWWFVQGQASSGGGGGLNGVSVKTGAYSIVSGDNGKLLILNSSTAAPFTLPSPPPSATFVVFVASIGTGVLTVSRNTLNIDGQAADLTVNQFQGCSIWTDATNYFTNGQPGATVVGVQNEQYTYATDTGSANAYAIAPAPAIVAYTAGQAFTFKAANANSAASTLNVNALGVKNITKNGSTALQGGEILAGQIIEVVYDGTQFQIVGTAGNLDRPDRVVSAVPGKPAAGQIACIYTVSWPLTFPANFASPNAYGSLGTNPTATATYTVYKNGVNVGTVTISTAGVFTFATAGGTTVSFNAGERLTVVAQGAQDATLADVGFTLVGTRTAAVPQTVSQGIFTWRGAYNPATAYNVNDVVSYFGNVYVCILPTTGNAPTNTTYWSQAIQNQPGGGVTFDYLFSTATANADPGAGLFALNNATQNTATALYIDTTDNFGVAMAALLDTLDASTNTVKGSFRLTKKGNWQTFLTFNVISRSTHTGYREYSIGNTASSAASPFAANDEVLIEFSRAGDAGGGATGTQIQNEAFTYASDSGTANAYAVTLSPIVTSYLAGLYVAFKAGNANTGASTLAVNGLSGQNIKKWSGGSLSALTSGDISANQVIVVIYDGTQFVTFGGGGGNSTAKYIVGDSPAPANLPNAKSWPGIYNSIDIPPASAGSLDDEFDAGSLSVNWTWENQGTATATLSNSLLVLSDPANAGSSIRSIYKTAPATPWEVLLKVNEMDMLPWTTFALMGIYLSDSTAKIVGFYLSVRGTPSTLGVSVDYWANDTTYSSSPGAILNIQPTFPWYLKVKDDGTNLIFSMCTSGISGQFFQFFSVVRTVQLASGPTRVGISVASNSSNKVTNGIFDYFRRTV